MSKYDEEILGISNFIEVKLYHNSYNQFYEVTSKGKPLDEAIESLVANIERKARNIFIPVKGYEGLYEVSSEGQVRSIPRPTTRGGLLWR